MIDLGRCKGSVASCHAGLETLVNVCDCVVVVQETGDHFRCHGLVREFDSHQGSDGAREWLHVGLVLHV